MKKSSVIATLISIITVQLVMSVGTVAANNWSVPSIPAYLILNVIFLTLTTNIVVTYGVIGGHFGYLKIYNEGMSTPTLNQGKMISWQEVESVETEVLDANKGGLFRVVDVKVSNDIEVTKLGRVKQFLNPFRKPHHIRVETDLTNMTQTDFEFMQAHVVANGRTIQSYPPITL